jgi:LEA14-like dessication related protein
VLDTGGPSSYGGVVCSTREEVPVKKTILFLLAAISLLMAGCASQGPDVVTPPSVRASQQSLTFTPDLVTFEAKVLIHNNMRAALDFDRVDYAVDLFDKELFTDSFNGMKRTNGNGDQTVTVPFQIAMDDILKQVIDVVSEESMRVTFRGEVYPAPKFGFDAIPFSTTLTIPIPKIPVVTFLGARGVPFSDTFALSFRIRNPNSFPFSVDTVQTFLEINDRRFSLLHTVEATEMQPGGSGVVMLRMENTTGKTLGMALSLAQSPDKKFAVTGTIRCGTPYGWFIFPVKFEGDLK